MKKWILSASEEIGLNALWPKTDPRYDKVASIISRHLPKKRLKKKYGLNRR